MVGAQVNVLEVVMSTVDATSKMHEAGVYSVCFREIAFAKMAQRRSLDRSLDGKVFVCTASAIACVAWTRL